MDKIKQERKRVLILLVVGLSLISAGCLEQRTFKQVRFLMGTPVEISVVAKDKESAHQAIDSAFGEIKRIEQLMSSYDPESALSRLNQRAGGEFVKIDRELLYVIAESIRLSRLSRGAFDVTVAPLIEAYGFDKAIEEGFALPSKEEITRRLSLVGSDKIVIDEKNSRVRFSFPGMKIDLGGIAKGYAVDRAIEILKQRGIDKALVNLGGNIFALGSPREGGWQIGIQHPRLKDRIWATIELDNEAAATSGNYERFFDFQGERYGHIIDPETGRPVVSEFQFRYNTGEVWRGAGTPPGGDRKFFQACAGKISTRAASAPMEDSAERREAYLVETVLSATVIARSALEADGLSTAVFVLGAQEGMGLIESIEGVEGVIITRDRKNPHQLIKQIASKGLEGKLLPKEKRYSRLW